MSFGEFYAPREKERQDGFVPPKKKMKKQPLGKSAVPAKHMDVEVKVGIASLVDGVSKSRRGKIHSVIVKSNAEKGEITHIVGVFHCYTMVHISLENYTTPL